MSALLDSLLDPERQRQCAEHDQFSTNPKDTAMKHAIKPSRVFADMEASISVKPVEPFDITIIRPGQPDVHEVKPFVDGAEAYLWARDEAGPGAVVLVRHLIEQNYYEGKEAYPRPLHPMATIEARAGWIRAEAEAKSRCALNLQAIVHQANVDHAMWERVQ